MFNLATGSNMPETAANFGDGFLMLQGYTIAACGWQADVPSEAEGATNLMTLDAPVVDVTGPVSCEIVVDTETDLHSLGSRYHDPYEPVADGDAVLTVRAYPYDEAEEIGRDQWAFDRLEDGRAAIRFPRGFEPGRIYNLVYTGKNPTVMGTGFAATRDFVSFLKYGTDGNPLGNAIERAYAFGSSQSGRFLRHMLYEGFNGDEAGRKVFDGVFANVAGGARGSFNHRFAQPSRHASAHFDALYPTEMFPFTDLPQTDPKTPGKRWFVGSLRCRGGDTSHFLYQYVNRILESRRIFDSHRCTRARGCRGSSFGSRLSLCKYETRSGRCAQKFAPHSAPKSREFSLCRTRPSRCVRPLGARGRCPA